MQLKNLLIILSFLLFSCMNEDKEVVDLQHQYANVLDISRIPQKQFELAPFGFSDLGAWHGYALPPQDSTAYYGGFIGPLTMKMRGQWLSKSFFQLHLEEDGKAIDLTKADAKMFYYPGKLGQLLTVKKWKIELELIFISNRSALLRTHVTNIGDKEKTVRLSWAGKLFSKGLKLSALTHAIQVDFADSDEQFFLYVDDSVKIEIAKDQQSYRMESQYDKRLQPLEGFEVTSIQSHYFNKREEQK